MTLYLVGVGIAVVVLAFAFAASASRLRLRPIPAVQPRPVTFRSIRVLQSDDDIREVAQRARERERLIAYEADRRAAHFDELTRAPEWRR
jgi:hypothetical protein